MRGERSNQAPSSLSRPNPHAPSPHRSSGLFPPGGTGWKPGFDENAGAPGGHGVPFETKLQSVNRLQEGRFFDDGNKYTRDTYKAMADDFAAKWMVGSHRGEGGGGGRAWGRVGGRLIIRP